MMRAVGSTLSRVDVVDKVAGVAQYPGDIDLPGQLWMKVVFAGIPHAQINTLNVDHARAAPGVVAVLTAADVPVNEYGLIIPDQPVLCGPGSTPTAAHVRWEADQIALVVAETKVQAEAAAQLIKVDYTPLPVITDPLAALAPDAPRIHANLPDNILHSYRIRRGHVESAFAQADVIVESKYRTHAQEHAYLQPEAGLAFVRDDGRIEVIIAGQWMHEDRQQIAHALGLPEEQIVVRYPAIGGAFGGREDMSLQIVLALAAWKTGRPIKTIWSREESIVGHHKRHPFIFKAKWGATKAGKVVAAQMDVISDAGGYMYTSNKVLGNALVACLGPYDIPNVHVDARTVLTNNCPSGAFRGFGGPQGHFAAEMQMTKLAAALGMDPVELRVQNVLRDGALLPTQSVVPPGCTAAETLEEAARRGGWIQNTDGRWQRAAHVPNAQSAAGPQASARQTSLDASRRRLATGAGIAVCYKNVGFSLGFPEHCYAKVELYGEAEIEKAVVGCLGADVGQGAHTAFLQIAADALNLPPERVELQVEHTDITGSSGSASASRLTFMAGHAIQGAAAGALQEWQHEERPARCEFVFHPRPTTMYDPETGVADPSVTYGYCAQYAEVAVDLDTGHVEVTRLVSVNDVGKAINPQLVEGQIEGAAAQAIGWTLLENFIQKDGRTLTPHLSNYLIPGVLDIADVIEPVILEIPDPQGPLGLRGMAEMPMIPTAPAIAAAIHNATGIWIDQLPIVPERMWAALQALNGA